MSSALDQVAELVRRESGIVVRPAQRRALEAAVARAILGGEGRTHPLCPEVAARTARVLVELGLAKWAESGAPGALGVVSSEGTELERSPAFVAYRDRYEEGRRFLSERRQS